MKRMKRILEAATSGCYLLCKHAAHPLRIWCLNKYNSVERSKAETKEKNVNACKIIVTNAAYVWKDPAGSASDFVKLNYKDQLNLGVSYLLKNDGNIMSLNFDLLFMKCYPAKSRT